MISLKNSLPKNFRLLNDIQER